MLLRPTDPAAGIAIDLRAPFGYAASGRVQRPTLVADASAPASPTGLVWPAGTRVTVPQLPPCLVTADRATAPPPCRPGEVGRASTARAPELPRVPLLRAFHEIVGVTAVPETIVIDREGRVATRIRGALTSPAQVEGRVERVR